MKNTIGLANKYFFFSFSLGTERTLLVHEDVSQVKNCGGMMEVKAKSINGHVLELDR